MKGTEISKRIEVLAPDEPYRQILTPAALAFVGELEAELGARREQLLERRRERDARICGGELPDFLPGTAKLRDDASWRVAQAPADLQDRRVEITGPPERKMLINALNSGASVYMADFEDSNAPTWDNCMEGQVNLRDAVRGTISFAKPDGKQYRLNDETATLMVRPRGWHLVEKHVLLDGKPISASLFDFGLFFYHNAQALLHKGSGPYFYLPKLESHLEARLWNEVFLMAQDRLDVPRGTIRATVLIETILAAFEMEEILFELREHSAGLNCGRWDYIFSFIKRFRTRPDFVLPDRARVTMTVPFMHDYSRLTIKTCHRRGAHAIGGMAAQIPIKDDPVANEEALAKVRADKVREAGDGHDGTWVAHPGLVPLAKAVFDELMPQPNQLERLREDVRVSRDELLRVPEGPITEEGLRRNIDIGIQYLESWLGGNGCVPIYNLMEDAATAEISRTQVWQWIKHPTGKLEDGRDVTAALVHQIADEELARLRRTLGAARFDSGHFGTARQLFEEIATGEELAEFLTLRAYEHID